MLCREGIQDIEHPWMKFIELKADYVENKSYFKIFLPFISRT